MRKRSMIMRWIKAVIKRPFLWGFLYGYLAASVVISCVFEPRVWPCVNISGGSIREKILEIFFIPLLLEEFIFHTRLIVNFVSGIKIFSFLWPTDVFFLIGHALGSGFVAELVLWLAKRDARFWGRHS